MTRNISATAAVALNSYVSSFPKVKTSFLNQISVQSLLHSNKIQTLLKNFSTSVERSDFYSENHHQASVHETPSNELYREPPKYNVFQHRNSQVSGEGNFFNGKSQSYNDGLGTISGDSRNSSVVGVQDRVFSHAHSQNANGSGSISRDLRNSGIVGAQDRIFSHGVSQNSNGFFGGDKVSSVLQNATSYGSQREPNMNMEGLQSGPPGYQSANSSRYAGTLEELDDFCKENKVKEAVEVLEVLEKKGVEVDLPRHIQLMQMSGNVRVLQYAKYVHSNLMKSSRNIEVNVQNKILEMYSKCGSMSDAFEVFDKMLERNLTSWDIMISGLAKNGRGEDAIDLFTQFKEAGLIPDGLMFMGVFSACSVLCDIVEGMLHFESMSKVYGIDPSMEHYASVVNMLGSTGYLVEAKEFIEKMPIEPSVDVWLTLMNICKLHGDTKLEDHCVEIVNFLDPSRLNDESKERLVQLEASVRATEQVNNKLADNFANVKNKVHEYRAGDKSDPENEILYTLLRGMSTQMKELGYVPNVRFVLHDVDEESRETALMAHSERLAVARGLISSPCRSPIRVIKNLRICGDCHSAMKIISEITGRELIMRDAKRFHHFKDGLCSCKDFW